MMKKYKVLFLPFLFVFMICFMDVVNAKNYTLSEIPDDSYVIGTHLFSSSLTPSTSSFYSGIVDSSVVMLGSTTIDASAFSSSDDFIIYYKIVDDIWIDSISGNDIDVPEEGFAITHVNGVCVDSSCMGNAIPITFLSTAGLEDVFETKTVNVGYGEKIAAADIPMLNNRPGYQFTCWTLKGEDECFDLNTAITDEMIPEGESAITLETKWNQIEYTIAYTNFDGTVQEKTCSYGNIGAEATDCHFEEYLDLFTARPNYTFIGWSTSKEGGTVYSVSSDMSSILGNEETITLYAVWDTMKYTISYALDGGTFTDTISPQTSFNVEDTTITLPTVSKVGYTFKNWTYNGTVFDGNTLPKSDITLTAVWEPITYSFVYDTQSVTCTYDQDCTVSITDDAIPEGRKFVHWYILDNSNKIYIGDSIKNFTTEEKTFTLKPEYEMIDYHVTYDYDGGVAGGVDFTSFQYDSLDSSNNRTYTLHVPTKDGYTFAGWDVQSGNLAIRDTDVTISGSGDVFLKALWNENSYTMQYYNGADLVNEEECTYTECSVISDQPTKEAYVFDGWVSETSGLVYQAGQRIANSDFTNNFTIKLVAKWTNDYRYTISYQLNGGSFEGDAPSSYLAGETLTLPVPIRNGYTFTGWTVNGVTLSEDANGVYTLSGYKEDLKIEAQWNANQYSLQFMMNGVTLPLVECSYDTACSFGSHLDQVPQNYKLLGWSLVDGGALYYGDDLTVKNLTEENNAVITLYSVLEDTTVRHTISYYLDGGQLENASIPDTLVDGDTISLPVPTKEGYVFKGWLDIHSNTIILDGEVISTDLLLVAQWEIQTYTISYVDEDGNAISVASSYPTSYTYGTKKVVLPGNAYLPDGVNRWKVNGTDLAYYSVYDEETSNFVIEVTQYENITVVGYKTTEEPIEPDPVEPEVVYYEVSFYDNDSLLGVLLVEENDVIVSEKSVLGENSTYTEYADHKWMNEIGEPFAIQTESITSDIRLYLAD